MISAVSLAQPSVFHSPQQTKNVQRKNENSSKANVSFGKFDGFERATLGFVAFLAAATTVIAEGSANTIHGIGFLMHIAAIMTGITTVKAGTMAITGEQINLSRAFLTLLDKGRRALRR